MIISKQNIKSLLIGLKVDFVIINDNDLEDFQVASLFNPIFNAFYFYNGRTRFDYNVKNSIILINDVELVDGQNTFILVNQSIDVQKVYYQILVNSFKRKSTGKICDSVKLHSEIELGENVQIDSFCLIGKAKIGNNCIIGSHCKIEDNTVIGENTIIESGSVIGTQGVAWVWDEKQENKIVQPQLGGVEIGSNSFLGANTIIVRGSLNENTKIGNNVLMAPGARLGHGTNIEDYVHFANNVATAGNVKIGKYTFVGSSAVFRPKVNIHPKTIIGAGAVVVKNTSKENLTLMGNPAQEHPTKENPSGMPKPKK